jgi:5-methylcytosine-specific restriction endonuclease McrA
LVERDAKGRFVKGFGKHSEATKKKIGESLGKGEKHPSWKGGKGVCRVCGKPMTTHHRNRCRDCFLKDKTNRKKWREAMTRRRLHYKGGISPLAHSIRNLPENRDWIKEVFKRDNYTCQFCGKRDGSFLHAHHIRQFKDIYQEFLNTYSQFSPMEDKETLIRLAIKYEPFWNSQNGKTLCKKCHKQVHFNTVGGE